jgi:hypothetical protein
MTRAATPVTTSASPALAGLGLAFVALLALVPLAALVAGGVGHDACVDFIAAHASALATWASEAAVLVAMALAIWLRAWVDLRHDPWSGPRTLLLMVLAALLTEWHYYWVDARWYVEDWQRESYLEILGLTAGAPHQFRALPYGLVRGLEWFTGDWRFACLTYRWFFTYWFLWACYRFGRLFHSSADALALLAPVVLLYPVSVLYYWGQLTDPLSHALFVLALAFVVENRTAALAAALFLGVLAKETVVLVVPAYLVCYWGGGWRVLARTAALALACLAAFLLARLPLGWQLGYEKINGTEGLMIGTNLGIDWPALGLHVLYRGAAPRSQNYLQPLLFVATFLPFILWNWRATDGRLRALFVTLTPLLLASNLCFGWLYESRNYMPLVPLLATMALPPRRRPHTSSPPHPLTPSGGHAVASAPSGARFRDGPLAMP